MSLPVLVRVKYCNFFVRSFGFVDCVNVNEKLLLGMSDLVQKILFVLVCFFGIERGVYSVTETSGLSANQVLAAVEALEAQAPEINARSGTGGIGTKFKLADVV